MSDDLSHDTHLRAALRHAPDHALAPPAGVSQAILNAARQVHRPARPAATAAPAVRITVARPRALEWARRWFASPRLAGGLATGLVAALGLGLWFDLGDQPVIDRAPAEGAHEMRSSTAAPPATPPAAKPRDAGVEGASSAQPAPAPLAAATETTRAKRAPRVADAGQLERKVETPLPRQAPAAAPPAPERREDSARHEAEAAPARAPVPATAPPAAAEPTAARDATTAQKSAAPSTGADTTALAQQRESLSKSDLRMSLAAGRAAAAAAPAGARASAAELGAATDAVAAASPALTLLRRARSELASGGARWAWMPPASPMVTPFDEAGQSWLTRLVQASRGRWIDVNERAGAGDALEVRWWRDDWPHATVRIEAEGLRWIEHSGRIRYAPLDAATLQRLRTL